MRSKCFIDERVQQLQNKFFKEAYIFINIVLILSILIKVQIYNMNFNEYITEVIALILPIIYINFRNILSGNIILNSSLKNIIYGSSSIGLISSIVITCFTYYNYKLHFDVLAYLFVIEFLIISILVFLVFKIYNISSNVISRYIEKKYSDFN